MATPVGRSAGARNEFLACFSPCDGAGLIVLTSTVAESGLRRLVKEQLPYSRRDKAESGREVDETSGGGEGTRLDGERASTGNASGGVNGGERKAGVF